MTTRLTLLCHASTAATRTARFPADEALDPKGEAELDAVTSAWGAIVKRTDRRLTAPALRARQTAAALPGRFVEEPRLRDHDYGSWTGLNLAEAEARDPQAAATWIADPASAPHGGERLDDLLARVAEWMIETAARGGRIAAVTHAAVIRAAIVHAVAAGPVSFWRIDVPPLSRVDLSHDGRRWILCSLMAPSKP